ASKVARPLVRLASPPLKPVLSVIAPVSRFVCVARLIVAADAWVVNDDVPPMVRMPVCVRLPTVSVTVRLPPTLEVPSAVAMPLIRLALPLDPLVFSDTAPVKRFVCVSVMVALLAEVVNDDVPPTVSTPVCVRLPI